MLPVAEALELPILGKAQVVALSSPSVRVNLQIALKLMRLFDDLPGV